MAYSPKPYEIAGVDLVGRRRTDGTIRLGADGPGTVLQEFPDKILLVGEVYTREDIRRQPDSDIEWGIYV